MKIDHVIDYRTQTSAHFTTYSLPAEIQRVIERNRNTLADIAANTANTIASQAQEYARGHLLGGSIDLMV